MKIVEKNRFATDPVAPTRLMKRTPWPGETEEQRLTRQLRRATERNAAEFDRGFQAAILMVAHGADLERLKEASGVVAAEWEDTQPMVVPECPTQPVGFDDETTVVEVPVFASGQ